MGNKIRHIPKSDPWKIVSPCEADWNTMAGDDKIRFCESCQKSVHNITRMTDREIGRRMKESDGDFCVMMYPDQISLIDPPFPDSDLDLAAPSASIALQQQTTMSDAELSEKKLARIEGEIVYLAGFAIAGAEVKLNSVFKSGLQYTCTSADSGFLFDGIEAGEYILTAKFRSLTGYEKGVVVEAGEIGKLDVELGWGMVLGGIRAEEEKRPSRLKK